MSSIIQPVQWFKHPLSDKPFPSAEEAEADYKRAQAKEVKVAKETERLARREELNNRVRLEAESPEDVKRLITEILAEHANVDLKFTEWRLTFDSLATTHDAPIGQKTSRWGKKIKYEFGWRGRASGSLSELKNAKDTPSWGFSDLCGNGSFFGNAPFHFAGVNSGGGGSSCGRFSYEIRLYLKDFPKMMAKYLRKQQLDKALASYQKKANAASQKAIARAQKQKNYIELNSRVQEIQEQQAALSQQMSKNESLIQTLHHKMSSVVDAEQERVKPKRNIGFTPEEEADLQKIFS